MAIHADTLKSLVSVSQFSKGHAIKVFERLQEEPRLIVLKNNKPVAVLLSPAEFSRLSEIEENYHLLKLSQERLLNNNARNTISEADVMASLNITEKDIETAEDSIVP